MNIKIVADEAIPFIKGRFPENVEVIYLPGDKITSHDLKDISALIIRTRTRCNDELLRNSGVKLIVTATIGTDHIDIAGCEKRGIIVRNAPGCNAPGVAQYVFASLFKTGFDPEKHTLGIIGCGNVGSIVADWAKQMGIKTLVSDAPRKEAGFTDREYIEESELLKSSDAVTLHVPFTKEGKYPTFHMIGKDKLRMMKPGAILVNTSRGGVVDEKALKDFLAKGKMKAIIDVWENEPEIDRDLASIVSVATPHIAGYSYEGKKRATMMALNALNETLGISVDMTGLNCEAPKDKHISRALIEKSYDPSKDTNDLLKDLKKFEELRNQYNYRHEPLFI